MPDDVIKVKLPQLPELVGDAQPEDKIFVYDASTGKLCQSLVSQLPFGSGGGGETVVLTKSATFKVRINSASYAYDAYTNSVTITDVRLKNRDDYPVSTTQLGGEFRDESLYYDPVNGKLTIYNFELQDGEHITIDVNALDNSEYESQFGDLATFKQILAPFMPTVNGPNGGKVWWPKSAGAIPAGWQECVAMRGYLPMAIDSNDTDFNKTPGSTLGTKTHTINSMDKLPKHRFFTVVNQSYNGNAFPYDIGRMISSIRSMIWAWAKPGTGKESYVMFGSEANNQEPTISPTNYLGKDTPDAINHLNPMLLGFWIEFIGLD